MSKPVTALIVLDTPLVRAEQTLTDITVRKPASGELRGVTLTDVLQMDVNALSTILPRLTTPTLTRQDVGNLDPADLVQLGTEVAGFLVPKANRPDPSPTV
ncbi:phage tail assembly protein [Silvimonas sp.]|uniref:phage tail assembly protein n=1 Tax=Silvimonas sp. TaxID=2650811 RepID=UPI00284D1E98|nr:phage tail assembly protein [Silvimonas sp.]MDR3429693.1 phage tail assembly protein [Silvimonas sp.]